MHILEEQAKITILGLFRIKALYYQNRSYSLC